jgi:hypothetical protein
MDPKRYSEFLTFQTAIAMKVGIEQIVSLHISDAGGEVHVMPNAFERLCGNREVSQKIDGGYNRRAFAVGPFSVIALYRVPQPNAVLMPGEYVPLGADACCDVLGDELTGDESPTALSILSDDEAAAVLSEQTAGVKVSA